MFFRDFRHQIEPDETKQQLFLETARERFYSNLSLLQLQLPELANQLRDLQPTQYTLTRDRAGHGNCIHQQELAMAWPPRVFEPSYILSSTAGEAPVLIAAELHHSGEKLVQRLRQHSTPFVLLYVPSLALFHASLHVVDWLPVLQHTQLIVQLESSLPATERLPSDLKTLAEHGVPTVPASFAYLEQNLEQLAAEQVWHFQQSLAYTHDCDPVLRLHTHKFKWHHEFRLQNLLIEKARQQPMPTEKAFTTLIICGYKEAILNAAAAINGLKRIIIIASQPVPEHLLAPLKQNNIQVHRCTGTVTAAIEQFVQLIAQLPPEVPWMCRLYQAGTYPASKQLRQRVEVELRYIVQPAMGVRRCLDAAHHAAVTPQHVLTRRTELPNNPVLLLGNGPSLAATLDAIHAGKAEGYLLVSCGTTLATLHAHGIRPHIHIELEFSSSIFANLSDAFLGHIHFCAPLGFHPGVRERFASHSTFVLAGHTFDELVPGLPDDTIHVYDAFPTVLNLGLALAGQLGVKELWLAGFDLAFTEDGRHHAAGSLYDKSDAQQYMASVGELVDVETLSKQKAVTKREFHVSAMQAQHTISRFTGMAVFQVSEGLNLGATYRTQLAACSMALHWQASKCHLPSTRINWQRAPYNYQCSAQLTPLEAATPAAMQALLEKSIPQLKLAKIAQDPALYWTLSLRRNIAALLLRLKLANIAEFAEAHSAFTMMLEDLKQAEAKI